MTGHTRNLSPHGGLPARPVPRGGGHPRLADRAERLQQGLGQQKIDAAKEGGGTVLDHSTILFGSNMSDSNRHNNDPLPSAVLGHAHGRIKGGQHLKYPQDSRFADLLLTLFDRNNIPVKSIGDSGGLLSEV